MQLNNNSQDDLSLQIFKQVPSSARDLNSQEIKKFIKYGIYDQFESFLNENMQKEGGIGREQAHEILSQLIEHYIHSKDHQKCSVLLITTVNIDPSYEINQERGVTLLMRAASKDQLQVVEALLSCNSLEVDKRDKQGSTALEHCIIHSETNSNKRDKIADLLLQAGANPNKMIIFTDKNNQRCNESFLINCLKHNKQDLVKSLLKAKIDINAIDQNGDTALHVAGRKGMEEETKLILAKHPNAAIVNKNNQTAYQVAIDILKPLILKQMEPLGKIDKSQEFSSTTNSSAIQSQKNKHEFSAENINIIVQKEKEGDTKEKKQNDERQQEQDKNPNSIHPTTKNQQHSKDGLYIQDKTQVTQTNGHQNTLKPASGNNPKKGLKTGSSAFRDETLKDEIIQKTNSNIEESITNQNLNLIQHYSQPFPQVNKVNSTLQPTIVVQPPNPPVPILNQIQSIQQTDEVPENKSNYGMSFPQTIFNDYYKLTHQILKSNSVVQRNPNNANKMTIDMSDESKRNLLSQSAQVITQITNMERISKKLNDEIIKYKQMCEHLEQKEINKDREIQELEKIISHHSQANQPFLKQDQTEEQFLFANKTSFIGTPSISGNNSSTYLEDIFICKSSPLDWENDFQIRELQKKQIMQFQNEQMLRKEEVLPYLNKEIIQFENEVSQYNKRMKSTFDNLIERVTNILTLKYPNMKLETYGSYPTQLCLPWSDIDIVLTFTDPQIQMSSHQQLLQKIENILKSEKELVSDTTNVANATVPVLKVTCTKQYDSKKLDITIMESKHKGTECVKLVNTYLSHYKLLRPLVLVLKQFLFSLELNDTYRGGLSSYSLILMLVYLLQQKSQHDSFTSEADLLIQFLVFYGYEDTKYVNPQIINSQDTKLQQKPVNQPFPNYPQDSKILIIDPHNHANNVSRSTYNYNKIKTAMISGYKIIHSIYLCESCQSRKEEQQFHKTPCIILKRFFHLPKCIMEYGDLLILPQQSQFNFYSQPQFF